MSAADVILIIAALWLGACLIAAVCLIAFFRWKERPAPPPLPSGSLEQSLRYPTITPTDKRQRRAF